MAEVIDPPVEPKEPKEPKESDGRKRVTCEFCGSKLALNGDVVSLGDDAKKYRDLQAKYDELEAKHDALLSDLDKKEKERIEKIEQDQHGDPAPRRSKGRARFVIA
jgi:hypothetical protein